VILHNGTPISWYSGLQSVVALSSCEAEYVAPSECCREVGDVPEAGDGLSSRASRWSVTIYEDNQGTIDLTNNPVHHKRTQHIDVKYHYIRVAQERNDVKVKKIHTDDNRSDIMTKATTIATFRRHVSG
jgi:hypothetical protein